MKKKIINLSLCGFMFFIAAFGLTTSNASDIFDDTTTSISSSSDMFDDNAEGSVSKGQSDIFDDKPKAKSKAEKNHVNKTDKASDNSASSKKQVKTAAKNISPGKTTIGVNVEGTKGAVKENLYSVADIETHKGKTPNTFYGKFIIINSPATTSLSSRDNIEFRMVVYWKFWTLMGEPVFNATARWQIRSVYLCDKESGMYSRYSSNQFDTGFEYVPPEVLEKVGIADMKILTEIFIGLNPSELRKGGGFSDLGHFIIDPGIISTPEVYVGWNDDVVGTLGYNIAGSPDWRQLILKRNSSVLKGYHESRDLTLDEYSDITSDERLYLPEDQAKDFIREAYEKKFSMRFNDILYVQYNTWPLREWLNDQNKVVAEKKSNQLKADKLQELRDLKKNKYSYTDAEYSNKINSLNSKYNNDPLRDIEMKDREIRAGKEDVRRLLALKRGEIDSRTLPGEKLYAFRDEKTGKYGYKYTGSDKIIIQAQYDFAIDFSEGLGCVKVYDKKEYEYRYGYINKDGVMVIPAEYDNAEDFREGLAVVKKDRKFGYINTKGETVVDFKYDSACSFSEGLASIGVKRDGDYGYSIYYGYINKEGVMVIPVKYDDANSFSDGLARIGIKKKKWQTYYGYINKDGVMVIPAKYEWANDFVEGLAAVKKDRKWGFIDKKGEIAIGFNYHEVRNFSDGMAAVNFINGTMVSPYGYIDKSGKLRIDTIYDSCGDFINGKATVKEHVSLTEDREGKTYYYDLYEIDKNGNRVSSKKRISEYVGTIYLRSG
ncbi:MAG: WG repeat-containing protein [Phycisphaerae bacterium]|nr:WG repeat-containing protein [Phycisphaerae bacterium]